MPTTRQELKIVVDDATLAELRARAAADGESVAAVVRRALDAHLAREAAVAGSQILADAVRGVVQEELRDIRRLALVAATHAAKADFFASNAVWILAGVVDAGSVTEREWRSIADREARRALQEPSPGEDAGLADAELAELLGGGDDL